MIERIKSLFGDSPPEYENSRVCPHCGIYGLTKTTLEYQSGEVSVTYSCDYCRWGSREGQEPRYTPAEARMRYQQKMELMGEIARRSTEL